MRKTHKINKIIILLGLVYLPSVIATEQSMLLIGHKDLPINELTLKQAKRIFLGKTTIWKTGDTVIPCLQGGTGEDSANGYFYNSVVKKSVSRYERYWNKQLFSGNGIAPKQFSTADEVVQYVKSNKGALCFVVKTKDVDFKDTKTVSLSSE